MRVAEMEGNSDKYWKKYIFFRKNILYTKNRCYIIVSKANAKQMKGVLHHGIY